MLKKICLALIVAAFAASCATDEAAKPAATAAPKPAAPAPAPAPAPQPVQQVKPAEAPKPKPVAEKISFASDVLFDFDKSVVKPEGKSKLDDLSAKMRGVNVKVGNALGQPDPTRS